MKAKEKLDLYLKKEIYFTCDYMNPFGDCSIENCFRCKNCDVKIVDKKGRVIKDFVHLTRDLPVTLYLIEIFDEVINTDLKTYFRMKDSNYRITRVSDGMIMRKSLHDVKEDTATKKLIKKINDTQQKILNRSW